MKNFQSCPKCESTKIARMEGGSYFKGIHNKVVFSAFKVFPVTRYICCNCGFTEEWIEKEKHLDQLHKKFGVSEDFDEFV